MKSPTVRIIGPGKAGLSFASALQSIGWDVRPPLGKEDDISNIETDLDFILITTPDHEIQSVAQNLNQTKATVAHISGATGLSSLLPHTKRASLHPLVSMPTPEIGKQRLLENTWFAIDGDPHIELIVDALGGQRFYVTDELRPLYHATACIASNHLVVLMAQVARLSNELNIPFDPFLKLSANTLEGLSELQPDEALTGPAARGDDDTVKTHLESLPQAERYLYECLLQGAKDITNQSIINESE
ncbi:MAG: DUF2520 domain-containing protein [Actinomycetota bacterium]|nr:DUF2520 domain-containing protein [Actinomycetota bacterium]MEC8119279.1 DUF2520 domain-containing protein [Actinomycetota bacterium]